MQWALSTLAIVAIALIGTILWSLYGGSSSTQTTSKTKLETLLQEQQQLQVKNQWLQTVDIEIIKQLQKLEDKINQLQSTMNTGTPGTSTTPTRTSSGGTGSVGTGAAQQDAIIPIPGSLLGKFLPDTPFKTIKNLGLFDLDIFPWKYTTWENEKAKIRMYTIDARYDIVLKNMKTVKSEVYTINDTSKSFAVPHFFINPAKADGIIRMVLQIENQTIGFEVPKTSYPPLKALLLKK